MEKSSEIFNDVLVEIKSGKTDGKLGFLYAHLALLHRAVKRPWREYSSCQEAIKQCLSRQANHYVTRWLRAKYQMSPYRQLLLFHEHSQLLSRMPYGNKIQVAWGGDVKKTHFLVAFFPKGNVNHWNVNRFNLLQRLQKARRLNKY